jgi:hypothetical protein
LLAEASDALDREHHRKGYLVRLRHRFSRPRDVRLSDALASVRP